MKVLCNRALVSCDKKTHDKCEKKKKASHIPGCEIITFLSCILTAYSIESKEGITIKATAVEEDKEYQVCTNFKQQIEAAQTRKRNSQQLNNEIATTKVDINNITRLTAVFAIANANDIVEEHTIFDDNAEEEREIKSTVGYCTKFPRDVL